MEEQFPLPDEATNAQNNLMKLENTNSSMYELLLEQKKNELEKLNKLLINFNEVEKIHNQVQNDHHLPLHHNSQINQLHYSISKAMKDLPSSYQKTKTQSLEFQILENAFKGKNFQIRSKTGIEKIQSQENHESTNDKWITEYVIVFPNPDTQIRQRFIDHSTSKNQFRRLFKVDPEPTFSRSRERSLLEEKAFFGAFNDLRSIDERAQSSIYKRVNQGGRYKLIDSNHWADTENKNADYINLILNLTVTKLAYGLHLKTRLLMSGDNKRIYLLISIDEEVLEKFGSYLEHTALLSIGATNLYSLQPCTKKLIPFYQLTKKGNSELLKAVQKLEEDLNDYFEFVQTFDEEYPTELKNGILSESELQQYKLFLEELKCQLPNMINTEDEYDSDYLKILQYKWITIDCLNQVRANKKEKILMNFWERLKITNMIPHGAPFMIAEDKEASNELNNLWIRYPIHQNNLSKFRSADRIMLLHQMINLQIKIPFLKVHGYINDYFPMHNNFEINPKISDNQENDDKSKIQLRNIEEREKKSLSLNIEEELSHLFTFRIDVIKNYFGEKIALYLNDVSLLIRYLLFLSPFGIFAQIIIILAERDTDIFKITICIYSLLSILITMAFVKNTKRRSKWAYNKWGHSSQEVAAVDETLPCRKGPLRRSPIDDTVSEIYFNPVKRKSKLILGIFVFIVLLSLIGALLYWLFTWRNLMIEDSYEVAKYAITISGILIGLQIIGFDYLFYKISEFLTSFEKHKRQSNYKLSHMSKTYIFVCLNNYTSIIFIAFFMKEIHGCYGLNRDDEPSISESNTCFTELTLHTCAVFGVIFLKNITQTIIYFIKVHSTQSKNKKTQQNQPPNVDDQTNDKTLQKELDELYKLPPHEDILFSSYLKLIIEFGYIVMFSIAFPLAPLLSCINLLSYLIKLRHKFLHSRRPIPERDDFNQNLHTILEIFGGVAITFNVGIICVTIDLFDASEANQYSTFVVMGLILFGVMLVLYKVVSDSSPKLLILKNRNWTTLRTLIRKQMFSYLRRIHTHNNRKSIPVPNSIRSQQKEEKRNSIHSPFKLRDPSIENRKSSFSKPKIKKQKEPQTNIPKEKKNINLQLARSRTIEKFRGFDNNDSPRSSLNSSDRNMILSVLNQPPLIKEENEEEFDTTKKNQQNFQNQLFQAAEEFSQNLKDSSQQVNLDSDSSMSINSIQIMEIRPSERENKIQSLERNSPKKTMKDLRPSRGSDSLALISEQVKQKIKQNIPPKDKSVP